MRNVWMMVPILWSLAGCEGDVVVRGTGDNGSSDRPEGSMIGEKEAEFSPECDSVINLTIRDFDVDHPDFERAHMGWGPVQGIIDTTLTSDRKPIFLQPLGDHQISQDEAQKQSYTYTVNNWVDSANPMFDGEESFYDWYRNSDRNMMFEKTMTLKPVEAGSGMYYFESLEEPYQNYFPLLPDEGFGPTPENPGVNPNEQNFLFTTEIHLKFGYVQGQVFRFSGDDDLWIFVNGKLALDLGGLHSRFNGSIDFDAQADALGIVAGNTYNMDIFHAERHTQESNFRIETNISCFEPVIVVK